jgi:hypothetical protein
MTHEQSVIRYFQTKPLAEAESMLDLAKVVVQTRKGPAKVKARPKREPEVAP